MATIAKAIDPPEFKADDDLKTIHYKDGATFKELDNNFEYRIGANSTSWESGEKFKTDPNRKDTIVVYVRKKAGEAVLARGADQF